MNDSQQALLRTMNSIVRDVHHRIEQLEKGISPSEWSLYRDASVRLAEMRREVNDLLMTMKEALESHSPHLGQGADQLLEDLQERLVALQTQLNSYRWQYSAW